MFNIIYRNYTPTFVNKLLLLAPLMGLLLIPLVAEAEASLGDDWAAVKKGAGNAYKAETTDESLAILADTKSLYNFKFSSAAEAVSAL